MFSFYVKNMLSIICCLCLYMLYFDNFTRVISFGKSLTLACPRNIRVYLFVSVMQWNYTDIWADRKRIESLNRRVREDNICTITVSEINWTCHLIFINFIIGWALHVRCSCENGSGCLRIFSLRKIPNMTVQTLIQK